MKRSIVAKTLVSPREERSTRHIYARALVDLDLPFHVRRGEYLTVVTDVAGSRVLFILDAKSPCEVCRTHRAGSGLDFDAFFLQGIAAGRFALVWE